MSTRNICFYGEMRKKLSLNYHQIPTLSVVLLSKFSYLASQKNRKPPDAYSGSSFDLSISDSR